MFSNIIQSIYLANMLQLVEYSIWYTETSLVEGDQFLDYAELDNLSPDADSYYVVLVWVDNEFSLGIW